MVDPRTSHDQPVVDEGTHPSPSPRERPWCDHWGHPLWHRDGELRFEDGTPYPPVDERYSRRGPTGLRCKACHQIDLGGDDPCLGHLPTVVAACCGHGSRLNIPYVAFADGQRYQGDDALEYFRSIDKGPPADGVGQGPTSTTAASQASGINP